MSAYTEARRARREARIPVGTPVEVLVMGGTVRATVTSIDGVMVQVRLDESGDLVYRNEDAVYDVEVEGEADPCRYCSHDRRQHAVVDYGLSTRGIGECKVEGCTCDFFGSHP